MPNIDQSDLEDKLSLFLAQIDQENLKQFSGGLCSGFEFMNFRADLYGEDEKNSARMNKLIKMEDITIIQMADSYQTYKNAYRALVDNQIGRETLPTLNREIAALSQEASSLRMLKAEKKQIDLALNENIHSLDVQIRKLRAEREECVQQALRIKCNKEKWAQIQEAEDIYLYIHSLAAGFDPGGKLFFHTNKRYVNQWDSIETLELLPVETADEKSTRPVTKALQLAFNFTEAELIALFSNQLAENTFCDGDFIRLDSTDHAIYLSKKNGLWQLYDPGPIEMSPNAPAALAALIKQRFFTEFKHESTYMPLGITVFSNKSAELEEKSRPKRASLIQTLINNRIDKNLDARAWNNTTAVSMAAAFAHVDTLKILIAEKADLNIVNAKCHSPLFLAAEYGHSEVAQLLIDSKVDCNQASNKGASIAYTAAKNGHCNILKVLIKAKADLDIANEDNQTPLMVAAFNGHKKAAQLLIAAKVDLYARNNNSSNAIYIAAENGHTQVMPLFIEAKADLQLPLEDGTTPLHIVAQNGHAAMIKTLWKAGLNLNQLCKKVTPAIVAAHQDRASVIKQLFECKADLNKPALDGSTPLHWAIKRANFATIKVLLECGADLTKADNQGNLPLDGASDEVEAFVILQQLKKNIQTHHWGATCPDLFVKPLRRIQTANTEKKWCAALEDIIAMKTMTSDPAISFLFSKLKTKDGAFNFEKVSCLNKKILPPEEKPTLPIIIF